MLRQNSDELLYYIVNRDVSNILGTGMEKLQVYLDTINSDETTSFREYIMFFIDHALSRIRRTFEDEKTRKSHHRQLQHENEQMQKSISALSKMLEDRRTLVKKVTDDAKAEINKNTNLLAKIKSDYVKKADSISSEFEGKQITEYNKSQVRQKDLENLRIGASKKTDELTAANEKFEIKLRYKRKKLISFLEAVLNQYDTDIGEKEENLAAMTAQWEMLSEERRQFQEDLQEQETRLRACMSAIQRRKIDDFTERHRLAIELQAAKTIQRWWRLLHKRKSVRKRKKKKKKRKVLP